MSAQKTNYYELLGLEPSVTQLEIKRAYRSLVKSAHPDVEFAKATAKKINALNERMRSLNEAYETLKDKSKRAQYDVLIGAVKPIRIVIDTLDSSDSDYAREQYLRQIFHPARAGIGKVLNRYKHELYELSQDLYNEEYLEKFEVYTNDVEAVLLKAATSLSSRHIPKSLKPGEVMMRYAIAQAADGLDELKRFCQNYDYDHLSMAGNLFREYNDLSRKALQLTKT
jgi:curved DNA-binding protein CbpA